MKKKILCGSLLLMLTVLFTGCSNAIPDMNEEERNMVINYAADIIQKYDTNHVTKLQEPTPEPKQELSVDQDQTEENEPAETPAPETEIIDNTAENTEPVIVTVDDFLQFENTLLPARPTPFH